MDTSRTDPWTRRRFGLGGGLTFALFALAQSGRIRARKKHHSRRTRCPTCPTGTCPKSCGVVFSEVSGGTICGTGSLVKQTPCTPCTSSAECTDAAFPQCVTGFHFVSDGVPRDIGVCRPYTNGLCAAIIACVIE